jgi:hypothetical protein
MKKIYNGWNNYNELINENYFKPNNEIYDMIIDFMRVKGVFHAGLNKLIEILFRKLSTSSIKKINILKNIRQSFEKLPCLDLDKQLESYNNKKYLDKINKLEDDEKKEDYISKIKLYNSLKKEYGESCQSHDHGQAPASSPAPASYPGLKNHPFVDFEFFFDKMYKNIEYLFAAPTPIYEYS